MSRKLDEAIAENLGIDINHAGVIAPYYSTDGNAMLELITELKKYGWLINDLSLEHDVFEFSLYNPTHGNGKCIRANADTMPEAVAKAAYKALIGKEFKE